MAIPIKPILGIFTDNARKRGSVLPLSKKAATSWAKGLDLPRGGKTVIYTGHMYQMIPAIDVISSQLAMLENSFLARFMGLGRLLNKFVSLSFFMGITSSSKQMEQANQILRDIVGLLRDADVKFGYLYEDELYAGALLYDDGLDESFGEHARKVAAHLKELGVERIITVDPHTTKTFRTAYPHYVADFDIEVKSYLEVLAELQPEAKEPVNGKVVVHDSCVYARYEEICEQPRKLLRAAGLSVQNPELAGKSTHCCGGPLESIIPTEAHRIAGNRIDQLEAKGTKVVTMCPVCLVNLRKAAGDRLEINDIASTLAAAHRAQ
jgi:Fe-S oxidoreductase